MIGFQRFCPQHILYFDADVIALFVHCIESFAVIDICAETCLIALDVRQRKPFVRNAIILRISLAFHLNRVRFDVAFYDCLS